ncbi:hypothetical protein [Luethyella okanaganae]|uniref:Uncharacterized protein n=1 Tax=Luethyella okanaganae TaxID=69372 RepID=A0ABW1VI24_9MICO
MLIAAITVTAGLILVLVWTAVRLRFFVPQASDAARPVPVDRSGLIRSARRRITLSIALTLASAATAVILNQSHPTALGLILALAPGGAAIAGLAAFVVYPSPAIQKSPLRTASLRRRTPWSFGARWELLMPVSAAVALIAYLVTTGLSASLDQDGLSRALSRADPLSTRVTTPYPGWYYAAPLIAMTIILLLCAWIALRRIAVAPAPSDEESAIADDYWRQRTTRFIVLLTTSAILSYAAGVLAFGGAATTRIATSIDASGTPVTTADDLVAGIVQIGISILFAVAATGMLGSLIKRVVAFWTVRTPETVNA